jgi:hypothetical protein
MIGLKYLRIWTCIGFFVLASIHLAHGNFLLVEKGEACVFLDSRNIRRNFWCDQVTFKDWDVMAVKPLLLSACVEESKVVEVLVSLVELETRGVWLSTDSGRKTKRAIVFHYRLPYEHPDGWSIFNVHEKNGQERNLFDIMEFENEPQRLLDLLREGFVEPLWPGGKRDEGRIWLLEVVFDDGLRNFPNYNEIRKLFVRDD